VSTGNSCARAAGKKGEAPRVKRVGRGRGRLSVSIFIVILDFGLISMLDKYYTTACVASQEKSEKIPKKAKNNHGFH